MKIKNNIIEILIFTGVLLLLFYSSNPVIYSDSSRYLNENVLDPPLYSSFISLVLLLFGSLNYVVILQTIFIGFSIFYFIKTVEKYFNLDLITKVIILLLLFLPSLKFYNLILTEPLSYAFSLLMISFIFRLIFNFNIQNLFWSTVFVVSLLLTRNQFIILYPVILLLYICIRFKYNSNKISIWLTISFVSIFLIHNSLIFLNTYLKQDSFKTESLTYVNLGPFFYTYIDAIYISSSKDVELFENQKSQKTLARIFEEMDNRNALSEYNNGRGHYATSLDHIKRFSQPLLENLANEVDSSVINLKKEISIKLIKANFQKYIKHIFKKFYDSTWLFIFVSFLIFLASIISFFKFKSNLSLLILFISSFSLANHSVVYLFGRIQPRYLIYTDLVLLVFIFLIFDIFLQKKQEK